MRKSAPSIALWLTIAAGIAFADQITKLWLATKLVPGEVVIVTGFFNLVHVFNTGAAFSFLANEGGWQRGFFVGVAIVASVIIVMLLRRHAAERFFCAALALILGGALGNLYDRVALGKVVDFLDFYAFGWHWPAFNLADSAITVGAAMLILEALRGRPHAGKQGA